MSNMPSSLEKTERDDPLDPKRILSAEALQRRRMLLKGAGGGGAALVAMTPLGAMAGNGQVMICKHKTTGKNVIATVSGVNSAAASFASGQVPPVAGGRGPATWCNVAKASWPKLASGSYCYNKKVSSVIGWASSGCSDIQLFDFMNSKYTAGYATEQQWVCAYVNALAFERGSNVAGVPFPYASSEVLGYISTKDTKANAFFSVYMASL